MLVSEGTETPGNPIPIPAALFALFLPYIGFNNENSLCYTALRTHEQNKLALHAASHLCPTAEKTGRYDW